MKSTIFGNFVYKTDLFNFFNLLILREREINLWFHLVIPTTMVYGDDSIQLNYFARSKIVISFGSIHEYRASHLFFIEVSLTCNIILVSGIHIMIQYL